MPGGIRDTKQMQPMCQVGVELQAMRYTVDALGGSENAEGEAGLAAEGDKT